MTKHKHAELIKLWADGAEIQLYNDIEKTWVDIDQPFWDPNNQYRIKPEEKKPVVRWLWAWGDGLLTSRLMTDEEVLGMRVLPPTIKLEWSRTEFPE